MPKLKADSSLMQERLEGAQSCLGNAQVYMDLIYIRMRLAAAIQPNLLMPAMDDLTQARGLIRRGQSQIDAVTPVCARASNG